MPHLKGLQWSLFSGELIKWLVLTSAYLRSFLKLHSHQLVGLPRSLFPIGSSDNILKWLLPSFIIAKHPVHLNIYCVNSINYVVPQWEDFFTSHHLFPNIRLGILFSNTLILRFPLNVKDRVSQPYFTSYNIIGLYIFILKFRLLKI